MGRSRKRASFSSRHQLALKTLMEKVEVPSDDDEIIDGPPSAAFVIPKTKDNTTPPISSSKFEKSSSSITAIMMHEKQMLVEEVHSNKGDATTQAEKKDDDVESLLAELMEFKFKYAQAQSELEQYKSKYNHVRTELVDTQVVCTKLRNENNDLRRRQSALKQQQQRQGYKRRPSSSDLNSIAGTSMTSTSTRNTINTTVSWFGQAIDKIKIKATKNDDNELIDHNSHHSILFKEISLGQQKTTGGTNTTYAPNKKYSHNKIETIHSSSDDSDDEYYDDDLQSVHLSVTKEGSEEREFDEAFNFETPFYESKPISNITFVKKRMQ